MTNDLAARATNAAIRAEMARRQIRQAGLADALNISQAQVSARLNGHIDWKLSELRAMAALFGLPLTDLIDATPVADAGFSALDATFPAAAVLAAVFLALALPGGTAAALAALAVVVGVGVREALAAHLRGKARLARAAHRGRRDRVADVERRESAIAVRRIYGSAR